MAQYVPYIQEVMPEPILYKPDYNFVNQMMQRKQSMFEQGVGQLRSSYQSVVNAPLSSQENIVVRDQYVKQAQEQLKKLSGADLSLPQNIQAAQSVFAPFWEDRFLLKDYQKTKQYSNEMQKLAAWRDSTDPKVRAMYSPIMQQYLNNGLRKLQNARRTDEDFARIESRQAIPFVNIEEHLQELASKNADGEGGLKVVFDEASPNGAYLVKTSNGERSTKNFRTWAEGMLGTNFDEQFKITGTVQAENIEYELRNNPAYGGMYTNMSDDEMKGAIANYTANNFMQNQKKRLDGIDSNIAEIDTLLKSFPDQITDPTQKQNFTNLINQRESLTKLRENVNKQYEGFSLDNGRDRTNFVENVKRNPAAYFGTMAKQTLINNWAVARAAAEKVDVTTNDAFFKAQELDMKKKQFEFDQVKEANLQAYRQAVLSGKAGKNAKVTLDENGNAVIGYTGLEGEDKQTGGRFLGLGTTDITQSASALDVYNANQLSLITTANDLLFGQKGAINVLRNIGLSLQDVVNLSSGIKRQMEQGPQFSWSKEEAEVLGKLSTNPEFSKYFKDTKFSSLKESVLNFAKDFYAKKGENNILNADDTQVMLNYMKANELSERYLANEKIREDLIKKHILADEKTYGKLIVTRPDGKKDLVTVDDIAKDMPERVVFSSNKTGKPLDLDRDDLARKLMAGQLKMTQMGELVMDGEVYTIRQFNNDTGVFSPTRSWNNFIKNTILPKYGDTEAFGKLYLKANQSVVPNMPYFQNKTAQVGTVWAYDLNDEKSNPQSFAMFQEILQPGNQANMYSIETGGNKRTVVDDMKERDAVRMLLTNPDDAKKYAGVFTYHTQGENGRPYISFNIKPVASNDKNEIGGVPVKDLAGKTYNIEISPGAQGPNLGNLPKNSGNYIYEGILQGKPVKSDPFLKSFGISYEVVPNDNRNPSGGTVVMNYTLTSIGKDPTTGQPVLKNEPKSLEFDFSLTDDRRVTPDELMAQIQSRIMMLMDQNNNVKKQYQTYTTTANMPAFDAAAERRRIGVK